MSALCVGKSDLFDSTDPGHHEQARKLCADCPVSSWCAEQASMALKAAGSRAHRRGAVLVGTWAGRLYGNGANDPARIAIEEGMFNPDEAREAHRAWSRGERDDRTRIGERVYQRHRARVQRGRVA